MARLCWRRWHGWLLGTLDAAAAGRIGVRADLACAIGDREGTSVSSLCPGRALASKGSREAMWGEGAYRVCLCRHGAQCIAGSVPLHRHAALVVCYRYAWSRTNALHVCC